MTESAKQGIFVFGASGHAKVVIDIIEKEGRYRIAFLVDDDPALKGREIYGYPVVGGRDALRERWLRQGVIAIGDNESRRSVAGWLAENGFRLVTAVHPAATLGRGVKVGDGTVIMAGAVINSDAVIGENVIVNTRASIDHDCEVGAFSHIAPGAVLCGEVRVGEESFVCAGATIIPNTTVGSQALVGAGATVIGDVADGVRVVGNPARVIGGPK
ncbi:hexapeptide transferase [Geomonas sp. Red276]